MTPPALFLAAACLLLVSSGSGDTRPRPERAGVVLRIPLRPSPSLPMPLPTTGWKESRGPRCVTRGDLMAAIVSGPRNVDFILRDRTRVRARLQNSCPALDYYSGFYLKPTEDGRVCRDRDAVHARSGGACEIDAFRRLSPRAAR